MGIKEDLLGKVFGRLEVISSAEKVNGRTAWLCKCMCGKTNVVEKGSLTSGKTKSCGCLKAETKTNLRHGKKYTSEYNSWQAMLRRCDNEKNISYHNYGAVGIEVCERWKHSFESFFEDMGKKPSAEYSLDRINVNGNYEPSNCRWATRSLQTFNQRKKRTNTSGVTGVKRHSDGWCAQIGVNGKRVYLGWHKNFEDAVRARKQAEIDYFK